MTSIPSSTQIKSVTPYSAALAFSFLEGDWPVSGLGQAPEVPSHIIQRIKAEANGRIISSSLSYLSLGCFFINTDLLTPHPTQRQIDFNHVADLRKDFFEMGILREDHPGVVIGLGDGWYQMKKNTPKHLYITKNSPHLNRLATTPGGPIGQVVRGGHRTAAIKNLSRDPDHIQENYWYYNVLVPSMF